MELPRRKAQYVFLPDGASPVVNVRSGRLMDWAIEHPPLPDRLPGPAGAAPTRNPPRATQPRSAAAPCC
jgi:hypothetical protein